MEYEKQIIKYKSEQKKKFENTKFELIKTRQKQYNDTTTYLFLSKYKDFSNCKNK